MQSVVHFEVPYDDEERVRKFYESVFNWKTQNVPGMPYVMAYTAETDDQYMIQEKGKINGGMYKRGGNAATGPVIVIDVPSVEEYINKVKDAGGSVVRDKMEVGDMGIYAQVKDTEGNVIGIWQNLKKE